MRTLQAADRGVTGIEVVTAGCRRLAPGRLRFRWQVEGNLGWLVIPAPGRGGREDGLWRHTCFEAFIAPQAAAADYLEINASPSLAWASYAFAGYRCGQRAALEAPLEALHAERDASRLALEADLVWDAGAAPRIGLCAVLEELDGTLSYWALAHAPGRPDFHRRESFVFELDT